MLKVMKMYMSRASSVTLNVLHVFAVPSVGSYGPERSRTYSHMLAYSRSSSYHKDLVAQGQMSGRQTVEGHNWLWGITGEQEWTPQTTTGL